MASVKIIWTNKYSHETGFVKEIDTANKRFINTFNESEAKIFTNAGLAASTIKRLINYGEGENNTFATVTV